MELKAIQKAIREQDCDGWLFYDHHRRDPIAYQVLGLPESMCTRRWYYLIPVKGPALEARPPHRRGSTGPFARHQVRLFKLGRAARAAAKDFDREAPDRHAVLSDERYPLRRAGGTAERWSW